MQTLKTFTFAEKHLRALGFIETNGIFDPNTQRIGDVVIFGNSDTKAEEVVTERSYNEITQETNITAQVGTLMKLNSIDDSKYAYIEFGENYWKLRTQDDIPKGCHSIVIPVHTA